MQYVKENEKEIRGESLWYQEGTTFTIKKKDGKKLKELADKTDVAIYIWVGAITRILNNALENGSE